MEPGQTEPVDERRQFAAPAAPPDLPPLPSLPFASVPQGGGVAPVPAQGGGLARTQTPPREAMRRAFEPRAALRRAFQLEIERGNAFLFAPVFMAAGALVYFTLRAEPSLPPLLLCLAASAALALALPARPFLNVALMAVAMFCAGMAAGKIETWRASTPMLGAEISTRLTGRVVRVEHQATGRTRLTLDVLATARPQLRYAPRRVRATARTAPQGLAPGDTVSGVVRLLPPSGPVRPGSYDFAFES